MRLPGRLRSRLALSHALVALASIGVVLVASVVMVRRYETRVEIERLTSVAAPLALRSNIERVGEGVGGPGGALGAIRAGRLDDQADVLKVRLLVVDGAGSVIHDTRADAPLDVEAASRLGLLVARMDEGEATGRQVAIGPRAARSPFPGSVVVATAVRGSTSGDVLVLVSARRRYPLLRRFAGPLVLITAASLLGAVGTGLLLSRRIARPVERLTGAVNAMASGALEQRVRGEGPDELGRLVGSFNAMSGRVATSSRSQRDLVANVAHELRTPLTSIRGYSRALADGLLPTEEERGRALATIDREAYRMAVLIGELLDLARLEAGAVALSREPVELGALLDEVVARFARRAAERAVALTAETTGSPVASGDRGRLDQIVANLVGNALEHTPAGGVVRVDGRSDIAGDGRWVVVTVADTGVGIAPDRLDRVFERFVRGDDAKRRGEGFGLGLPIVRELVALHGGTIAVASEVGAGTTVTVRLPAAESGNTTPCDRR